MIRLQATPNTWRRLLLLGIWSLLGVGVALSANKSDILTTSHNLSATGPGPVTSQQTEVCIFCHTPHNSSIELKPLWNRQLSVQTYSLYTSSTMKAAPQQPGQMSKLCLSCHDGTIAMGQTIANGLIPTAGVMSAKAAVGPDLSKDHPLAFTLVDDGQLALSLFQSPPASRDSNVKLFNGQIECSSCHDPHTTKQDPVSNKFLVRSNAGGLLCLACHDPSRSQPNPLNGWNGGSHQASSNSTPSSAAFGPYGNVASNACVNCHLPHRAPPNASPRLLRDYEEAVCSVCHSGTNLVPSISNVMAEFSKTYAHPTTKLSGLH
ncbi:MAG TPA: cytochrome c3 family protein, partial [Nitrospirota bacterium]